MAENRISARVRPLPGAGEGATVLVAPAGSVTHTHRLVLEGEFEVFTADQAEGFTRIINLEGVLPANCHTEPRQTDTTSPSDDGGEGRQRRRVCKSTPIPQPKPGDMDTSMEVDGKWPGDRWDDDGNQMTYIGEGNWRQRFGGGTTIYRLLSDGTFRMRILDECGTPVGPPETAADFWEHLKETASDLGTRQDLARTASGRDLLNALDRSKAVQELRKHKTGPVGKAAEHMGKSLNWHQGYSWGWTKRDFHDKPPHLRDREAPGRREWEEGYGVGRRDRAYDDGHRAAVAEDFDAEPPESHREHWYRGNRDGTKVLAQRRQDHPSQGRHFTEAEKNQVRDILTS